MTLSWGRKYLMCPPKHFGVLYEINPWMHRSIEVTPDDAQQQWHDLVSNLEAAGAELEFMEPAVEWPDLVFTANAGLVSGSQFIPSRFRHPERQGETPLNIEWFASNGFTITELPDDIVNEGAGDALPFKDVLVSGWRWRSDERSHPLVSDLLNVQVNSIDLVDPRLYHLDLTFCPLSDRRAIIAPLGWNPAGRAMIDALVPEPLVLDDEEALAFCANSVLVDTTLVMPSCSSRVGRQLEAWGYDVVVSPVNEFLKAGGGCRCLTLALDVTLGSVA